MEQAALRTILPSLNKFDYSRLLKLASRGHVWFDYDKEADVLYISFGKPQPADDAYMNEEDIIVRKKGKKIIGLTILNASRFAK